MLFFSNVLNGGTRERLNGRYAMSLILYRAANLNGAIPDCIFTRRYLTLRDEMLTTAEIFFCDLWPRFTSAFRDDDIGHFAAEGISILFFRLMSRRA